MFLFARRLHIFITIADVVIVIVIVVRLETDLILRQANKPSDTWKLCCNQTYFWRVNISKSDGVKKKAQHKLRNLLQLMMSVTVNNCRTAVAEAVADVCGTRN